MLLGGLFALRYLYVQYSGGLARTAWALLILVLLWLLAESLRRLERWVAAGIFAFASVIAWGFFVESAWHWFGWLNNWHSAFQVWSLAHLSLEFLILVAALLFRWRWRFPFIGAISAIVGWFFVTDFVSNGGTWSWVVSLIVGLLYLMAGSIVGRPSAFWLHFVGGLLIGVPIYHWCHTSDGGFAVILIFAVLFVLVAYATKRSSWAVFGTIAFFAATIHFAGSPATLAEGGFGLGGGGSCISTPAGQTCTSNVGGLSAWSPALGFGLLGLWLVLLGLLARGRRTPVDPAPA